jgi:hypothetical protein
MKLKVSKAKERENARQRRYFDEDLIQPFDEKGRRSSKFIRIYGQKVYGNDIGRFA